MFFRYQSMIYVKHFMSQQREQELSCTDAKPRVRTGGLVLVLQVLHKHRNTYPVMNALQLYQVQSHQSLYWYRYLANDAVGIKGLSANTNEL